MLSNDKKRLRDLANDWIEIAHLPIMEERKQQWKNLHGLKCTRPMILVETGYIHDYIKKEELRCADPYCRNIERFMLENIIHAKEVGDDIVLEKYFRIGWHMDQPSFGIDVKMKKSLENGLAYVFEHSIQNPDDMEKLIPRKFFVDKDKTMQQKQYLEDMFGDVLPIRLGNFDFFDEEGGYDWVGNFFFGLTWQLHRFIGLEQMMYWYYDYPDQMHQLMDYMVDDRMEMFKTLEREGCLVQNNDNQIAGPRFYGYCDELVEESSGPVKLNQLWAWCESQETSSVSVEMFKDFTLPYLANLAKEFKYIYYGCCEPVHDRLDVIEKEIKNIRAVSVSMWNDFDIVGDMIGQKYVYSRKPSPPPLSGPDVSWESALKDIQITKRSAKNAHLEFLFRDLYDINGDRGRLSKWVNLVKQEFDI